MGSLLSALRKMAGSKKDVRQVQMQQTDEDPVSSPASVVLSGISLPSCVIEQILLHLPLKDVHLCMTVCKSWYGLLQRNSFWKKYIPMHYDLTPVDDIPNCGLRGAAFGEWISEDHGWVNYELTEPWVFKPFPKLLKCDLIVSADYDPMKGMDVHVKDGQAGSEEENESSKINYHNLAISISILQHILQKSVEFTCCVPAFGNESDGQIMVWLAPANYRMKEGKIQQPNVNWVMSYFHANPQLYDKEGFIYRHKKQLTASTCYGSFGIMNLAGLPGNVDDDDSSGNEDEAVGDAGDNEDADDDEDEDAGDDVDAEDDEDAGDDVDTDDDVDADDEEDAGDEDAGENVDDGDDDIEKEDEEEKDEGDEYDEGKDEDGEDNDGGEDDEDDDDTPDIKEKKKSFQKWLSGIYRPSIYCYCGENIMNSVLYFHYTTLAPGYVGGIVSPVTMT